ncbi:4-diphosphocytidyl-2-C-methyl-D-erythritol kinase [Aliiroseovarius halocynthiae]|uniref:4-diphosphocytidyl-2-C-methyl-D-erythritol kinase n=1 Tax=Aliiroseovarius halocynthiae TaxID=985055 RepID=A0A545SZU4_9RHOB|nr:4-(cytidine 5'-diphospho)-2-C-methyl-D-erythritol kinase [Aliiroseovarius halocynthiae]TQV70449.1 4-(cytidine 5'-diphospho)-2-C-methyl-D-erythritol kinase [Aliiroseovarius halocynthiae]SMR81831.1 4-diphosphocytidyl-2-C-methyl-D-erythritol kinase [Aliiroseovarius halocynthiae]
MSITKVFAPAKVNLTLHVTGQRRDGYHLLDSLVVFADVGDRITVMPADQNRLEVIGPRAKGVPTDGTNLVARAANLFGVPVHIVLSKHLPAAAGIGGGSSDAAATILALSDMVGDTRLPEGVADLGADVRVCLMRQAARMRGIGEDVAPCPGLPPLYAVLANPGVDVPTPEVFQALENKQNQPLPKRIPQGMKTGPFIDWLATQRNDLEAPAIARSPVIQEVLKTLSDLPGVRLARMSGSGATCFALFETEDAAQAGATALTQSQPDWWVEAAKLS